MKQHKVKNTSLHHIQQGQHLKEIEKSKVAVVIPCFKVSQHILEVINAIGQEVASIYVVDDNCPEHTGLLVKKNCIDPRVSVIFRNENGGVGAATITGMHQAQKDGAEIIVKIDGDGQMSPSLINKFITPIRLKQADYTKGNRFFDIEGVAEMPTIRLIGNAVLSFFAKLSTGYWDLFDPTNGYIAIHSKILSLIPTNKINCRFFFETDLLFRLNTIRAVVHDIPMSSRYGQEKSNLHISSEILKFTKGHIVNFHKRIFYNYFLRNFSIASIELIFGSLLLLFGILFGSFSWIISTEQHIFASSGTVMLASLPIITGNQLLLAFLNFDMNNTPTASLLETI